MKSKFPHRIEAFPSALSSSLVVSPLQKRASINGEPVLVLDNNPREIAPSSILLTIKEMAAFLKISVSSARRIQQKRLIPFIKVGGAIRFLLADIFAYLQKQRVESTGQ